MALVEMADLLAALGESYYFETNRAEAPRESSGATSVEAVDTRHDTDWWRSVNKQALEAHARAGQEAAVAANTSEGARSGEAVRHWATGGSRQVSVGGRPGVGTFHFRGWKKRRRVVAY